MSVVTWIIETTKVERSNEGFPFCECGSVFDVVDHYKRRKPKEVYASVARCTNPSCKYHEDGYIGENYEDLKKIVCRLRTSERL